MAASYDQENGAMMPFAMHRTLLLNSGFEPLRIVSWQRAFVLIFQGKVEILEEYGATVHTVSRGFRVPAVIRLHRWVNLSRKPPVVRFSRANVYARDEFRCQYCMVRFPERDLTLDHVLPVVKGGRKTWENIVTACLRCNQKKGHQMPDELGMRLPRKPTMPRWLPGHMDGDMPRSAPALWAPYLLTVLVKGSGGG